MTRRGNVQHGQRRPYPMSRAEVIGIGVVAAMVMTGLFWLVSPLWGWS